MIAIVNSNNVTVTYGECSKINSRCFHIPPGKDVGNYSDSNSKKCLLDGKTVEQKCCPKRNDPTNEAGFWHKPNRQCHEQ